LRGATPVGWVWFSRSSHPPSSSRWVIPGGFVRGRHCGFGQAGVVRGYQAFHVTAQVVPQVPPVGDLHSVGRAVPGAVGVPTGPVSADHLHAGMSAQPVGEVRGFSAQEHVDRSVPVGQVERPSPQRRPGTKT